MSPHRSLMAAAALALLGSLQGQTEPAYQSPLSSLAEPREGQARHEGSWDRKHANDDALHLGAGQTATLFDYRGAGCVHRFWVTIAPREDVAVLSRLILRMYWDDDAYPSVECPIGAFFGVGFGEQKDFISLPLDETSGGYNCFWPMPFHRSARWTISNGSGKRVDAFYYNIDFMALSTLPAATRHFHAQFRRENPTTPGRSYTILETRGEGHYVGTALFMAGRVGSGMYFLEGNEQVYIDGAVRPTIEGTGTEDYFCSGWYFDRGTYSAPYHGLVIKDEARNRISAYRWHIEDAIPFHRSIRFTIEHGTGNQVTADYSSVAYYYLAGPAPQPPPLPADLMPSHLPPAAAFAIPGAIEAEELAGSAACTAGNIWAQDMGNWEYGSAWSKRGALFWEAEVPGAKLTLHARLPAGPVKARMVTGPDFGIVRVAVGNGPYGPPIDLYAPLVTPREESIGASAGQPGGETVSVELVGRNPLSTSTRVGIDAFLPPASP